MNPIFQWIIAQGRARRLLRRCPVCGHRQFVPRERLLETVRCVECGADIPPNQTHG